MHLMLRNMNRDREHIMRTGYADAQERATRWPIFSMPLILWKHIHAFGTYASLQPLTSADDSLWETADHHVLWLVFSLDARFATRYYHEWLRDFLSELEI